METNKHGVEGHMKSTGKHYGRTDKDGTFRANLSVFVPKYCFGCRHYDSGEMGDYGETLSGPVCAMGVMFPTQKGTCKRCQ